MPVQPGRGWSGSLRRRVAHEIRLHRAENRAMRRTRYSLVERGVRAVLAGHSFGWFVGTYVAVALAIFLAGALFTLYAPWVLPNATDRSGIDGFLKDATSYLIAAQVGLLAVVSVAVGLVTLIAQRDDRASTNTDIRLYYDGALAYEVVGSSVALLLILCVQIFWPLHLIAHGLGFQQSDLFDKLSLTGLHVVWLVVNITAFAQIIAITLRFVEPKAREQLRERRCTSELAAKMLQHAGRNDLDRIECPAGHLEEADLERERQPVQHPPPTPDSGGLLLAEREEMLDLDCRQGVGEPFSAEMAVLPSAHPRTLCNRP